MGLLAALDLGAIDEAGTGWPEPPPLPTSYDTRAMEKRIRERRQHAAQIAKRLAKRPPF